MAITDEDLILLIRLAFDRFAAGLMPTQLQLEYLINDFRGM